MIALLFASLASAADHHVVRPGETLATIAAASGGAYTADALRERNSLPAGAEPAVGVVLRLPGDTPDPGGTVLAASGTGTVTSRGGTRSPLVEGMVLEAGSLVCTAAGSYATLRVGTDLATHEHDEVSLLGGTCVRLEEASSTAGRRSSVLKVDQGSIAVRNADTASGVITVVTEGGVTTSQGGGFRLTVEGSSTRTEALDRGLSVLGGGVDQSLDAGYGSRVRAGEAPSAPVALLRPGTPLAPVGVTPVLLANFSWAPVDRALSYRVEIATAADFSDLVVVEDVAQEEWLPEVLMLPYRVPGLWWRVAAVDRTGFVGFPSAAADIRVPPSITP
jgi:hypothetical protein